MKTKSILICIAIVLSLAITFLVMCVITKNKAISREENIETSLSSINIAQKKRKDAVNQLVQVLENYTGHEQKVVDSVTEARKQLNAGETNEALKAIDLVVEAYPQITSGEAYSQLMQEISICENSIMRYRENYNAQVKGYKKMTRSFPSKQILSIYDYKPLNVDYIEFEENIEANEELFK